MNSAWRPKKTLSVAKRPHKTWKRRTGAKERRPITAANNRGGEPATFVSRERSAPKETEAEDAVGVTEDEFGGAAAAIELEFQGRLADIRKLPRRDRPGARTAAVEWRREALKALAEKRLSSRRGKIAVRRRLRELSRAASSSRPGPVLTPKP